MDIKSLSHTEKTFLLTLIAHELTVSARSTYEQGTENILKPQILRSYNELMHLVTSSIRSHVQNVEGMPLEAVIETMNYYGSRYNNMNEMNWVLKSAMSHMNRLKMNKFSWNDTVTAKEGSTKELRPGQLASIVGISWESERSGTYLEQFPKGFVYTIEFDDGSDVQAKEEDLTLLVKEERAV